MTNIEIIKDLDNKNQLKQLINAGIISPKILTYLQLYYHIDVQLKRGKKKVESVKKTAAFFNINQSSVYRALKAIGA